MKNRFLFCFILLALAFSCKQEKQNIKEEVQMVPKEDKLEQLIQEVLYAEKLEPYLQLIHQDTTLRLYMVSDKSLGITDELTLKKFEKSVKIVDLKTINRDSIPSYIRFEKLQINDNKALARLYYEIKGLGFEGKYDYRDNHWIQTHSEIWQN